MSVPFRHKRPTGKGTFSYGRVPCVDTREFGAVTSISYRLFRRDQNGKLHPKFFNFAADTDRAEIAKTLNEARHQLRNLVDDIDLKLLGVSDGN